LSFNENMDQKVVLITGATGGIGSEACKLFGQKGYAVAKLGDMRKLTYLAVFEPTETGYSVYFPDLPGCVSCGADFEAAQKQTVEVLGLHIYGMEKGGDAIPAPSKTPQVNPETAMGYIVSPVTVFPAQSGFPLSACRCSRIFGKLLKKDFRCQCHQKTQTATTYQQK
jgi:predicted RNase H-like HicB family nuclease